MKSATIQKRKRFAADLAARDRAPKPAAKAPTASDRMRLLARASVARRLVREGQIDGPTALSLAVWPSERVLEREQHVCDSTLIGRALGRRANQ